MAKAYASRHDCDVPQFDDLVHAIVSRVLSRYRNPGYRVFSFAKVLNIEIVHELSKNKGPKAGFLSSIVPLQEEPAARGISHSEGDARPQYLSEILGSPSGRDVVVKLRSSHTYRAAIRSIDGLVSRRWIYDHGVQLHYVYRVMHAKEKPHGQPGGNRNCRDAAPDLGDKRLPTQGGKAKSKHGHRADAGHLE
jgi:hypothetical protein